MSVILIKCHWFFLSFFSLRIFLHKYWFLYWLPGVCTDTYVFYQHFFRNWPVEKYESLIFMTRASWRNIMSWCHIHGDGCWQTPIISDYQFNFTYCSAVIPSQHKMKHKMSVKIAWFVLLMTSWDHGFHEKYSKN